MIISVSSTNRPAEESENATARGPWQRTSVRLSSRTNGFAGSPAIVSSIAPRTLPEPQLDPAGDRGAALEWLGDGDDAHAVRALDGAARRRFVPPCASVKRRVASGCAAFPRADTVRRTEQGPAQLLRQSSLPLVSCVPL